MDFPPRWLQILVVLATLATLAYAAIAEQWLLVGVVLILLLIEVFMSGPVDLKAGWLRVTGYLGRQPASPAEAEEANPPTS